MTPRRAAAPGDAGVGLPELLVTMALFTVLAGAVAAVFIGATDTVRTATTKNATTADTRIAMEAITRTVRVAVRPPGETAAVVEARTDRVTVYASLDRGPAPSPGQPTAQSTTRPTRVTYAHDAATGCLTETQVLASASTAADAAARPLVWSGTGSTRCLVRTTSAPAFTYFDVGTLEAAPGGGAAPPLALGAAGLPPAGLPTVVSVGVAVTVTDPGAPDVRGVSARDRVTLANVLAERPLASGR